MFVITVHARETILQNIYFFYYRWIVSFQNQSQNAQNTFWLRFEAQF